MHKVPLIEADYVNYDYLGAKSVAEQILDRSVTGRPASVILRFFDAITVKSNPG